MHRRLLSALTVLVLWTMGYLAYVMGNSVRPSGPAEPPAREDARDAGEG
ncbi:MAG TPA: hypothetical protein VF765_32990 [Polyangiaceae bacterium]